MKEAVRPGSLTILKAEDDPDNLSLMGHAQRNPERTRNSAWLGMDEN
jgi:hypothetical protein